MTGVTYTLVNATGGASDSTDTLNTALTGNIADTVTMATGSTLTYLATGTVALTANGTVSDVVSVAVPSGSTDPNGTNNSATAYVSTVPTADLKITNTDNSGGTEIPGKSYTYTIIATDLGPDPVNYATIVTDFGTKMTVQTYSVTNGNQCHRHHLQRHCEYQRYRELRRRRHDHLLGGRHRPTQRLTGTLTTTATVTLVNGINDPNTSNNVATDTEDLGNPAVAD